jgi:hypothetical protein
MSLIAWDTTPASANSYVTRAQADSYFIDAIHAAAWKSAADSTKDAALISATRMLDRSRWMGSKTSSTQALEWPRTGASDKNGTSISSTIIPTPIRQGTYELALALIENNSLASGSSGGVKSLSTSRTSVEFWAPNKSSARRLPQIVWELVGYLLEGPAAGSAGTSFGTDPDDNPSSFEDMTEHDRNDPYG